MCYIRNLEYFGRNISHAKLGLEPEVWVVKVWKPCCFERVPRCKTTWTEWKLRLKRESNKVEPAPRLES
jgi:hypothetical protein